MHALRGQCRREDIKALIYTINIVNFEEFNRQIIPSLKRFGVKRASLFGSLARGEDREDSDIDILVEFEAGKSLLDLAGLKIELEELLGRRVDLLTFNSLHPLLKDKILKEQKPIL
jgi:predicted nucleotidyltransferase